MRSSYHAMRGGNQESTQKSGGGDSNLSKGQMKHLVLFIDTAVWGVFSRNVFVSHETSHGNPSAPRVHRSNRMEVLRRPKKQTSRVRGRAVTKKKRKQDFTFSPRKYKCRDVRDVDTRTSQYSRTKPPLKAMVYQPCPQANCHPLFLPFPFPFPLVFNSTNPSSFSPSARIEESRIPGKSLAAYTRNGSDHASARIGIDWPVSSTEPQFISRNWSR